MRNKERASIMRSLRHQSKLFQTGMKFSLDFWAASSIFAPVVAVQMSPVIQKLISVKNRYRHRGVRERERGFRCAI